MAIEKDPLGGKKSDIFASTASLADRILSISENDRQAGEDGHTGEESKPSEIKISIIYDHAINYAFQQNAIPVVKELRISNVTTIGYKSIVIKVTSDPGFVIPIEIFVERFEIGGEFRKSPLDLKLNPSFLRDLTEKIAGLLKLEVWETNEQHECTVLLESGTYPISLLAHNEWCGLEGLPEILAAFVLPNDPAVMHILGRAADLLEKYTGSSALNGYQDKNRKRVWDQVAAIYKAVAELKIRYINPPASFEKTGQKVRFPSEVVAQKFGSCLDLVLLIAACCEQSGLFPLILMHEGHAYAGCWLDESGFGEPCIDNLQQIRKWEKAEVLIVFETTILTHGDPTTLEDAEREAKAHLITEIPFKAALDIHGARIAKIHPLPIPGVSDHCKSVSQPSNSHKKQSEGLGNRDIVEVINDEEKGSGNKANRIDQWKSKLLDLTLRNRLLNFRETKSTILILAAEPEKVEDNLAADVELSILPKPKVMSEGDPRNAEIYTTQKKEDLLAEHLKFELKHKRLHSSLVDEEHDRRLTALYRASRLAMEENGANTLFIAVGMLEWRETQYSDRTLYAPLLLVPVHLKRKSVLEGFSLVRYDEEPQVNVTLIEMLKQQFRMEIPALDPLPSDDSGVDVHKVMQIFREAVSKLKGWEVKPQVWLAQFSFAKYLLWKDLSTRLDILTKNRVVNHLVTQSSTPYSNTLKDIQAETLDDQFHPKTIYCPRSADSSQLAAVLAAAEGHDFVLEGPPGTGKSQTISNIIAHCLAHGKRVLFIAEKRAALDVVHRRLKEEGLEAFCLELHSNKTGKGDVVAQFDRTLKHTSSMSDVDWDSQTEMLRKTRNELNDYVRALHRTHACGLSAFQCLDYLLPRQNETTSTFSEALKILEITREKLDQIRAITRQLQDRSKPFIPLADHPLTDIHYTEWTHGWAENALKQVHSLNVIAESALSVTRETRKRLGFPTPQSSIKESQALVQLIESLLKSDPVGPKFLTAPSQSIEELTRKIRDRCDARISFSSAVAEICTSTIFEPPVQYERWTNEEADRFFNKISGLLPKLKAAIETNIKLESFLSLSPEWRSREALLNRVLLVDCLIAPYPVPAAFIQAAWGEFANLIEKWIKLVGDRDGLRKTLKDYNEGKLLHLDLKMIHLAWSSAQSSWFFTKMLKTLKVQKFLRSASRNNQIPPKDTISIVIDAAIKLNAINAELAKAAPIGQKYLGVIWVDGEPDLETLERTRDWGQRVNTQIIECTRGNQKEIEQVKSILGTLFSNGVASFASGTPHGNLLDLYRDRIAEIGPSIELLAKEIGWNLRVVETNPDFLNKLVEAGNAVVRDGPRVRRINEELNTLNSSAESWLGTLWKGGEPCVDSLERVKAWGEKIHSEIMIACTSNPQSINGVRTALAGLFTEGSSMLAFGTSLHVQLVSFNETYRKLAKTYTDFADFVRLNKHHYETTNDFVGAIAVLTTQLPGLWISVRKWCAWQRVRDEALANGLSAIVDIAMQNKNGSLDLNTIFERSFRRGLFFAIMDEERILRDFLGHEHTEKIKQFCNIDEKVAALTRDIIRLKLGAAIPKNNISDSDKVTKEELGLLKKEIGKKARHIPVRQLLSRIPILMGKLKPCVLMSPLSVAQYLDPSHTQFDLVIFDEASQIPVWDAVGAIARGNQLIVVGDPKQLPPTAFFASQNDSEEESADPNLQNDLESILDELLSLGLCHKRLKWHYRSRHEGLIAFSNMHYYDNDLLTFPSVSQEGGVSLRYLSNARYDMGKSRTNLIEAKALVEELVKRLCSEQGSRFSYGVVTFNQAQQDLIENLLDEERRKHSQIEVHFGETPPVVGEPVFVKNLENVQGDERDVIFFSICYGLTEAGKLSLNFGPLNKQGGHRRLNVAITRAKHELVVFSGLRGDQLDLTRTNARGVRDLKYFIEYAERGPKALISELSISGSTEPESEFEMMVASKIRERGVEVRHQVGCSGYRIDLAIVDPKAPGRYLLGIECDGATYHRSATARDRDKLRQKILEGLGWRMHRIWSTDWWHDSEGEINKLFELIESLKACE